MTVEPEYTSQDCMRVLTVVATVGARVALNAFDRSGPNDVLGRSALAERDCCTVAELRALTTRLDLEGMLKGTR